MSFGLPCIGRAINAMPELIDDGENGALVSGDDPVKLAELIENICSKARSTLDIPRWRSKITLLQLGHNSRQNA